VVVRPRKGIWDPVRMALFGLNVPVQGLFLVLVGLFKLGDTNLDLPLVVMYLVCSVILVSVGLSVCCFVCYFFWYPFQLI
jgi:hypothetical membrane protein